MKQDIIVIRVIRFTSKKESLKFLFKIPFYIRNIFKNLFSLNNIKIFTQNLEFQLSYKHIKFFKLIKDIN